MLHGILNKIAFKTLSSAGKGLSVKGEIVDQTGRIVTTFSSSHLGMGSFYIQPDSNNSYFARITSPGKIKPSEKYPLPEAMPKGYILTSNQRRVGTERVRTCRTGW